MVETELGNWLAAYKKSWESQDPELFASLFSKECAYRDTPFVEPVPGAEFRAFWRALAKLQSDNHIEFEVLGLVGDRAIVNWHAFSTRTANRERREGDGIFVLSFAADGRCSDVREWQHWRIAGSPLEKRSFTWDKA